MVSAENKQFTNVPKSVVFLYCGKQVMNRGIKETTKGKSNKLPCLQIIKFLHVKVKSIELDSR